MANFNYPKSFYQVFECSEDDYFSYDENLILFEDKDLARCHNFAYEAWKKDNAKFYTIIQPYDGSCRGGYGFSDDE